jgi:GTPase involved in cell partitioning and DNA repair
MPCRRTRARGSGSAIGNGEIVDAVVIEVAHGQGGTERIILRRDAVRIRQADIADRGQWQPGGNGGRGGEQQQEHAEGRDG